MITVESRVRRWGHSLGLVIPRGQARVHQIKVGDKVELLLRKKTNVLRETFGTAKIKKPTDQMMSEIDKLLYDDR